MSANNKSHRYVVWIGAAVFAALAVAAAVVLLDGTSLPLGAVAMASTAPPKLPDWLSASGDGQANRVDAALGFLEAERREHPKWSEKQLWVRVRARMLEAGLIVEDVPEKTITRPRRGPGRTGKERSLRLKLWILDKVEALRQLHPTWSDPKLSEVATAEFEQMQNRYGAAGVRLFAEWEPTSREPQLVNRHVLLAAALRLPQMRWLEDLVLGADIPGPENVNRRPGWAALIWMAGLRNWPHLEDAIDAITHPDARLAWALDYPYPDRGPSERQVNRYVHALLGNTHPFVVQHVMVDLHRTLHEREHTIARPLLDKRGEPVLNKDGQAVEEVIRPHIKGGQVAITDGCLVEANVPQGVVGVEAEHRRLIFGGKLSTKSRLAATRAYTEGGKLRKLVTGVYFQPIVDGADGLPWATTIRTAGKDQDDRPTGYEPRVQLELIEQVKFLHPEYAPKYAVADALHDAPKNVAKRLFEEHRTLPVFHRHHVTDDSPEKQSGTPRCKCGKPAKPWKARPEDWWNSNARMEWICATGVCGFKKTKFVRDDPHNNTVLPRTGTSQWAALRSVLLALREQIESFFAALQWQGLLGKGLARPRWCDDDELNWLLSLGALLRLAKRVAYENGDYHQALAEAKKWGVLDPVTDENPRPGPDRHGIKVMRAERKLQQSPAAKPRSWDRLDDDDLPIPNIPWGKSFLPYPVTDDEQAAAGADADDAHDEAA